MDRSGLSVTAKVMLAAIGGLFLVFLALGLLATTLVYPFEQPGAFGLGLLWGCLLSAAKVVLLEKSLSATLDLESKKPAQLRATLQAALRYLLTIAVLACVFLFPHVFGLFGTIIGILTLQLSAYVTNSVLKRREARGEAIE